MNERFVTHLGLNYDPAYICGLSDEGLAEKIRESIMELLSSNGMLSRKDLTLLLNVTEGSVRHHLNKLQEEGLIKRVGPDKGGHWEVLK